jgi:hypothetical protein
MAMNWPSVFHNRKVSKSPPPSPGAIDNAAVFIRTFQSLRCMDDKGISIDGVTNAHEFQELASLEPTKKTAVATAAKMKSFLLRKQSTLLKCSSVLFIGHNLTRLSPSIFEYFPHIERVTLLYVKVKTLPREMARLKSLKELRVLSCDKFRDVEFVFTLKRLESLEFNQCPIKALPPSIKNLQRLKAFKCTRTGLTQLPREMKYLTALTELKLEYNRIKSVPTSVFKMLNLRILGLMANPLTYLPQGEMIIDTRDPKKERVMEGYLWFQIPNNRRRTLLSHSPGMNLASFVVSSLASSFVDVGDQSHLSASVASLVSDGWDDCGQTESLLS